MNTRLTLPSTLLIQHLKVIILISSLTCFAQLQSVLFLTFRHLQVWSVKSCTVPVSLLTRFEKSRLLAFRCSKITGLPCSSLAPSLEPFICLRSFTLPRENQCLRDRIDLLRFPAGIQRWKLHVLKKENKSSVHTNFSNIKISFYLGFAYVV